MERTLRLREPHLVYFYVRDFGGDVDVKSLAAYVMGSLRNAEGRCGPDDLSYGPLNIKPEVKDRALTDLVEVKRIPAAALSDPSYDYEGMAWQYAMDTYSHRMLDILRSHDRNVLSSTYRALGRFTRLKLSNFTMVLKDAEDAELELKCEPDAVLHSIGVLVLTVWITLPQELSVAELNLLIRNIGSEKAAVIVDPAEPLSDKSLNGYLDEIVTLPLMRTSVAGVLHKDFGAKISDETLAEVLRTTVYSGYWAICVTSCVEDHQMRELDDSSGIVDEHPSQILALLTGRELWENTVDARAREELREAVVTDTRDRLIALGRNRGLWIGTARLRRKVETGIRFTLDPKWELKWGIRELMASLVHPVSFLVAQRHVLDFSNHLLTREQSKALDLDGLASLRDTVRRGIEEYYNIDFMMADPHRAIVDMGKNTMGLDLMLQVIVEKIEHRTEVLTTEYERRLNSFQVVLTIIFGILGGFGAVEVVWTAGTPLGWTADLMLALSGLSFVLITSLLSIAALRHRRRRVSSLDRRRPALYARRRHR